MSGLNNLFTSLTKVTNCYVTLGIGTTKLLVIDNSTIIIYIYSHVVELQNFLFVPFLEDTLFSITEQIQTKNYSLKAEQNKYTLYYPTLSIYAKLDNEVHVIIKPCTDINRTADFSTTKNQSK